MSTTIELRVDIYIISQGTYLEIRKSVNQLKLIISELCELCLQSFASLVSASCTLNYS